MSTNVYLEPMNSYQAHVGEHVGFRVWFTDPQDTTPGQFKEKYGVQAKLNNVNSLRSGQEIVIDLNASNLQKFNLRLRGNLVKTTDADGETMYYANVVSDKAVSAGALRMMKLGESKTTDTAVIRKLDFGFGNGQKYNWSSANASTSFHLQFLNKRA